MTYYESEIKKIRSIVYSNQDQLNTVIAMRNYFENNYDKDLNLELLSKILHVSKYHLLRLFKRYYGLTPRQYLMNLRIEKSKTYLKNGKAISETYSAVGFESLGSFSNLFKRKTGKSPTQYQNEQFSINNPNT